MLDGTTIAARLRSCFDRRPEGVVVASLLGGGERGETRATDDLDLAVGRRVLVRRRDDPCACVRTIRARLP